jgi:hypothetical protein
MINTNNVKKLRNAYRLIRQREEKKGFFIHSIIYCCVNTVLVTVNLLFVREFLWFLFPLCGWGIGIVMHYIFGIRRLGKNIKREEHRILHEAKVNAND